MSQKIYEDLQMYLDKREAGRAAYEAAEANINKLISDAEQALLTSETRLDVPIDPRSPFITFTICS